MSASKLAGGRAAPVDAEPPRNAPGEGRFRGGYHMRFLPMLVRLYWLRLRTQPVQEALAVAGIAIGVALIFAVEIANTSVPASVRQLVHGIAGKASLEVASRTPEGFDQGLVPKVGEAAGVFGASGALEAHVTVIGPHGRLALTLFGAEAGIGAIGGSLARRLSLQTLHSATPAPVQRLAIARQLQGAHLQTVALPEEAAHLLGAAPGQLLLMDVRGRSVVVLCGRVLSARVAGAAAESPVVISTLSAAQTITGLRHRATRILVLPARAQEALARRSLTNLVGATLDVRSSASEVSLLEEATRSSNQVAALFVALSVVVGLLFAYNAMLLTLPARRRWISRLRDMGAYRHELGALLAVETLVLGVVASLVGLVLGDLLSGAIFGAVPRYLTSGFPIGTEHLITTVALLVSVGGGMLATIVASAGPTIGVLRKGALAKARDPRQLSLTPRALLGRFGIVAGIAMIGTALALGVLVSGAGLVAVGALAVGLGLVLAPAVPWLIERSVGPATRLHSPAAYIATTELRAAPIRAMAVAATSGIALYAIVAIGGSLNDVRRGVHETVKDMLRNATVVVSPSSFAETPIPTQPFPSAPVMARLRELRGVSHLDMLGGGFLDVGSHRLLIITKPADDRYPVSSSQIIEGSQSEVADLFRGDGWVALSSTVAHEWHLHLGSSFVLPTPSGYASFRLAATITNYGWPPGAVVMSQREYTRRWRSNGASVIRIRFRRGIARTQAVNMVRAALIESGLTTTAAPVAALQVASATNQGMSQLSQIAALALIAAVLAVVATMAGSIWQRRSRLVHLKRLGMSRAEMVGTIYLETGIVVSIGAFLGALFGLGGQPLATLYIRHSTGFPEAFSPALALAIEMVAIATGLAVLATGALGLMVTRRKVMWRWFE